MLDAEIEKAGFIRKDWNTILKNKRIDILVDKKQMVVLLEKLGHKIDENGFIIDAETGEKAQSNDGKEIKIEELGAIIPGTKNFIRKNIASFSQFLVEHC